MDLDAEAARIGRRQRGLITIGQAAALGFTSHQVAQRLRTGRWEPIRPRVYAFAGTPRCWEQTVLAAVLSLGDGVMASHDTALRLLGGRALERPLIEVSSVRERRIRADGVQAHRSLVLFDADRSMRGGIPATAAARLVVDLSSRRTAKELGLIVDDLQRRRLLRLAQVAQCINRLGPAPGRSPATVHEVLSARWDGYDPGDSDLESRVLRLVASAGLPVPRQQVRVGIGGRRVYLDLAYPDVRLAIEIDSWTYHRFRSAFDGDRAKGNELMLLGWHVLRLTDAMTDGEIVALVRRALQALGHSAVA